MANDPILVCTRASDGPRWQLSRIDPTTTSTVRLVTTTTTCVLTDPAMTLQAAQAELDSLIGGRRQAASAVDQIQLVADNAGRQVEIAKRYVTDRQTARDTAAAAFAVFPGDTNRDRLTTAERYLADAKDVVASWEAVRTKALTDLSRGRATLGDWDRRIGEAQRAVTAAKASQGTLTCS